MRKRITLYLNGKYSEIFCPKVSITKYEKKINCIIKKKIE